METHPFGVFIPDNASYLFLGSFTGKIENPKYNWFFANGRNQFWPIMEEVYKVSLDTKEKQQKLFNKLKMAITDIILSCERKDHSNLDMNLTNITLNTKAITSIFGVYEIKKVYFSSRFAEKLFRKYFKTTIEKYPKLEMCTLPSPSPRYATMSKLEKIAKYIEMLPKLN